jgi:hypothetical protein
MSSAINHAKRSHNSAYRTRGFSAGGRLSVITPSLSKDKSMQLINQMARFLSKKKGENNDG